jgi:hypothetical protein
MTMLDLFLTLHEEDLHEVIWTEDLLSELRDAWVARDRRTAESAERVCDDIRRHFPEGQIQRSAFEALIPEMPGPDPDDHIHAAAAAACAPCTIVTANLSDFPKDELATFGVTVVGPDDYLQDLFAVHAAETIDAISKMAEKRTRPPATKADILDALEKAGAPSFVVEVRRRSESPTR